MMTIMGLRLTTFLCMHSVLVGLTVAGSPNLLRRPSPGAADHLLNSAEVVGRLDDPELKSQGEQVGATPSDMSIAAAAAPSMPAGLNKTAAASPAHDQVEEDTKVYEALFEGHLPKVRANGRFGSFVSQEELLEHHKQNWDTNHEAHLDKVFELQQHAHMEFDDAKEDLHTTWEMQALSDYLTDLFVHGHAHKAFNKDGEPCDCHYELHALVTNHSHDDNGCIDSCSSISNRKHELGEL
eukprot:TRINITY_DN3640_c0_g1_i1.p1 TRINITY_DN3640_c0_g1~~TRINITY_DN3640_c0_g1_i1.p1  ORF type:complete len:239 (+),score=65.13 TRINITY_DN3640_c0_g1_i1:97-813(+)